MEVGESCTSASEEFVIVFVTLYINMCRKGVIDVE